MDVGQLVGDLDKEAKRVGVNTNNKKVKDMGNYVRYWLELRRRNGYKVEIAVNRSHLKKGWEFDCWLPYAIELIISGCPTSGLV